MLLRFHASRLWIVSFFVPLLFSAGCGQENVTTPGLSEVSTETYITETESFLPVVKIKVRKRQRRMWLLDAQGETVKHYGISLGSQPRGAKYREGDGRTPEGLYEIDYKNANSNFHLSLHIDYPRARDRRPGVDPGGEIFIHGYPNRYADEWWVHILQTIDWTEGCIAVSNRMIEEIWDLVPAGTPIEILP